MARSRDEDASPLAMSSPDTKTSLGSGVAGPVFARIDGASLLRRGDLDDGLACCAGNGDAW